MTNSYPQRKTSEFKINVIGRVLSDTPLAILVMKIKIQNNIINKLIG